MMDEKFIFGMFTVSIVTIIQLVAWYLGYNGQVFAFTSLIIGLISGSLLGFTFNIKESIKDFTKNKTP